MIIHLSTAYMGHIDNRILIKPRKGIQIKFCHERWLGVLSASTKVNMFEQYYAEETKKCTNL